MMKSFNNNLKKDVYETVTNQIIEGLNKGFIPWRKPWKTHPPMNLITKKAYRGINLFLLDLMSFLRGYKSPYWLTFRQCMQKRGKVQRGEKGTQIIFWKWMEKKVNLKNTNENDLVNWRKQEIKQGYRLVKNAFLKFYTVFNYDQCRDLKDDFEYEKEERGSINEAERIIKNYRNCPIIQHGGNKACYIPSSDEIRVPMKNDFESVEDYYSTLFHESIHSTGHTSRLNREELGQGFFSSEDYSKEELIAEMGASFLNSLVRIKDKTIENSTAYIQSWLKVLKNDKKLVLIAASQAQKAVDYILDVNN